MAENSKIEWTTSTWNPVTGCTKISDGCKNCYAEKMARRLAGRYGYPKEDPFRVTLHPERLKQPLKWRGNKMVFVCSMSDLFHQDIPNSYIDSVIGIIKSCPNLTFQILTKRADRMVNYSRVIKCWPSNVWIGVTVESEKYRQRIDLLRKVNASIRFLSCEPLIGGVRRLNLDGIDWVIAGGESGFRSRPMALNWATSLRDQCVAAGKPYFFKQWGGPNKKKSGRVLEGREWNQVPDLFPNRRTFACLQRSTTATTP